MAIVSKPAEKKEEVGVLDSNAIISRVYESFDAQILQLDTMQTQAKERTTALLKLLFSKADIFRDDTEVLNFITLSSDLSVEIGLAFQTVLEVELAKEHVNNREQTMMPMPTPSFQQPERPNPNVVVTGQPPKGGGWADYFGVRRWAQAMEKIFSSQQTAQQPAITTNRVLKVLEYGQELLAEWNNTFDFYEAGIDILKSYDTDVPETYEREHKLLAFHMVKLCNIICTFSKTIAEYRKERFGDRKASVAAGMIYLEAAKAASGPGSVADYYRNLRREVGPQDVGGR